MEYDLGDRSFDVKILLVNHERSARRIRLSVAGLGQDLDGTPRFLEPAEATEDIALDRNEVVLAAGARADVRVTGQIPADDRALYAAVVAEFEPLEERDVSVDVVSRVASLFLLRGPKPWEREVDVVDVGLLPGSDKAPLPLYAAVDNIGNVHVKPRGRIEILQKGRLLGSVDLRGETIIPGFTRRLVAQWRPPKGLTGRVKLRGVLRNPRAVGIGYVDFSDGAPRRPGADIANLVARDEGGAHVELILTNTGTTPIEPTVTVEASRGGFAAGSDDLRQRTLNVGESRKLTWERDLEAGTYLITARAMLGDKLLDEAVTGVEMNSATVLRWVALAALAVSLLGLVGFLWWRKRSLAAER